MSFFNPELPQRPKKEGPPHPWEKTIKHTYSGTYKYGHNSAENPIYPTKKEEVYKDRLKLTVIGNRVHKEFIYCYFLAKLMHKYRRKQFDAPVIRGVSCVEWPKIWNDLKLKHGGYAFCIDSEVAVLVNDKFLGGKPELKKFLGARYIYHLCIDYYKEGIKLFADYIKSSGRPCAYMQFSINDQEIGTMIFMLYSDIVPLTCENFLRLCETPKAGYAGTPVHRIVKDGWIQCGGFGLKDNPQLDCENFIVHHDRRGVLCMANADRHIDCSTQFFVLLQAAPWMEHKYVAFGQLIEGEGTLRKIEDTPTWYESPTADIRIFKCGIFNMDCHWIPINKNTHEYIHGHIENLFEIGEIFYEELLMRVFLESEFKQIESMPVVEEEIVVEEVEEVGAEGVKDIHATKRFIRKKSASPKNLKEEDAKEKEAREASEKEASEKEGSGKGKGRKRKKGDKDKDENEKDEKDKDDSAKSDKEKKSKKKGATEIINPPPTVEPSQTISVETTENREFDVDEYKYEYEEYTYPQVSLSSEIVVKPEKPYYIPLTDVPYPGEVASAYNLQKVLRGDFCHEIDLEMDPEKRKDVYDPSKRPSIPETLLCALFECFETDSFSESSLDSEDELDIKNYLKDNGDTASFAGPIIKRIANIPAKYAIFDTETERPLAGTNLMTDDELRIIRMAEREYKHAKAKKVSISLSASKLSHLKIQRRPTGFVRMSDLASIHGVSSLTFESLGEEMHSDEDTKRVRIVAATTSEVRRTTMQGSAPRPSVLARLYVDVALSDDEEGPTLKDYRPPSDHKSFMFITKSDTHNLRDDSHERLLDRLAYGERQQSIDEALDLQYGNKISRKISYDYVRSINRMEHKEGVSIRSLEFAKKRPSMSVLQYKKQNKLYQEQMMDESTPVRAGEKQEKETRQASPVLDELEAETLSILLSILLLWILISKILDFSLHTIHGLLYEYEN